MKNSVVTFIAVCFLACNRTPPAQELTLTPAQAIQDFRLPEGFVAETAVAEPDIEAPVAMAFDADGAMWVVEMPSYMSNIDGQEEKKPSGRIKICTDKNKDGTYETIRIFLDSLILPRAVCPIYGGVLVANMPNLWFYEIQPDGRPGKCTLVDSTYAEGLNPEHAANGLLPGLDNWIYNARSDKRYRLRNGQWEKETTNWRGQWGISQDAYGRLVYNDNSTLLRADQWQPGVLPAGDAFPGDFSRKFSGKALTSNRVWPRRPTPGVNRGYEPGILDSASFLRNVTSACGLTVYSGDNFPEAYQNSVFVPEPTAYLLKHIALKDSSGFLTAQFTQQNAEFLTATDECFRPVNTCTGPDGCLYVVDMHRGNFQHITYQTPYLRDYISTKKLDQVLEYGRIFRIRYQQNPVLAPEPLSHLPGKDLVALLAHRNGWQRSMAQQLLVQRCDTSSTALLEEMAINHVNPLARLHALWTLEGIGRLRLETLGLAASSCERASFENAAKEQIHRAVLRLFETINSAAALEAFTTLRKAEVRTLEMQFCATAPAFWNQANGMPLLRNLAKTYSNDSLMAAILAGKLWQKVPESDVPILKKDLIKSGVASSSLLIKWLQKRPDAPAATTSELNHLNTLERQLYREGKGNYAQFCQACHGQNGEGTPNIAPPLAGSGWVNAADKTIPLRILLDGIQGKIQVGGKAYDLPAPMPGIRLNQGYNDGNAAKILTYIRNSWGNHSGAVSIEEVTQLRMNTQKRNTPWLPTELTSDGVEPVIR